MSAKQKTVTAVCDRRGGHDAHRAPLQAAPTGRKKSARGKERSDAALGHDSQITSSPEGAKERGMVALGELSEGRVSQDGPPSRGEFSYVDISSIDRETKRIVDPKILAAAKAPSRAKQVLKAGDVVVSMTRPNLNAVALVPPDLDGAIGSTGFHVLRAKDAEPGFLFYAVQTTSFIDAMCLKVQGALYPAVRPKDISSFSVHPFSLKEQRRIVAEIEKQFTRLDAGVAALRRVQTNLERYRAAVLKAACDGGLVPPKTPSKEWSALRLADVCKSITDGDHQPPPKRPQGIPLLTIGNISSGKLDFSDTRFVPEEYYNQIKPDRIPNRDEVLYSVVGATIGIPVLVNTDRLFCFSRHVALLKPSPKILPKFLWLHMASPDTHREAWRRITGSAQPTLALRPLREMPVKLPPLAEQTRIVAEVERRLSVVEELESVVSANLQRASSLRQSILKKAFTGELV